MKQRRWVAYRRGGLLQLVTKRNNARRCSWSNELSTYTNDNLSDTSANSNMNKTHTPKRLYNLVIIVVQSSVIRVPSKIVEVDGRVDTANEDLHLLLVKHAKPFLIDHFRETLEERRALLLDLFA